MTTRLVSPFDDFPLATILTPNIPEAELLLLQSASAMVDRYGDGARRLQFTHQRIDIEGHGTGCTLASAIAANLCRGQALHAACEAATDYVHGALRHAVRPGRSQVAVLNYFWQGLARA